MSPAANLDWLYHVLGWTLAGAGVVLLLWAAFWERSRGRRRCPKCWYDMNSISGRRCPECGREPPDERGLFRTRRRWRFAALSLLVFLGARAVWSVPEISRYGWPYLIPSPVLATAWPIDIESWMKTVNLSSRPPSSEPVLEEWLRRCGEGEVSAWSATHWARRVKRHCDKSEAADRSALVYVGDLIAFDRAFAEPRMGWHGESLPKWSTPAWGAILIAGLARDCVDPEGWVANGGDRGELVALAPWLIVRSTPKAVRGVQDLVSAIRDARDKTPQIVGSDWARLLQVSELLERPVTDLTPATTILEALERIRAATGVRCAVEDPAPIRDVVESALTVDPDKRTARQVLDACVRQVNMTSPRSWRIWLIDGDQVLITNHLDARAEPWGRATRIYHVGDFLADARTGNDREKAIEEIRVVLRETIEPDGWVENGGDKIWFRSFADRLVISARPTVHKAIEDLLTKLRDQRKR